MATLRERACPRVDQHAEHAPHEWEDPHRGLDPYRCPGFKSIETRMLQRLIITCKAFALTREDRLEIADQILRRPDNMPITSYNDLNADELRRMLDAMTGAVLVAHIVRERQSAQRRSRRVHNPSTPSTPAND